MKTQYIPKTRTGQRPGKRLNPESITIHSTANPNSSAQNEADYVCYNSKVKASFHFVVDEKEVIQVLPENEVAYHSGTYAGNLTSLSIEMCESGDREAVFYRTIELTKILMNKYNIPISRVYQHYDWNRKNCPRILIDKNFIKNGFNWEKFKKCLLEDEKMEKIYNSLSELQGDFKSAVEWALKNKILFGTGNGLGLSESQLKSIVFLWRYDCLSR